MAASRFIEEESGTDTSRPRHPHNGYYAGDFSQVPLAVPELRLTSFKPLRARSDAFRTWQ
jgi:hypothetical protein